MLEISSRSEAIFLRPISLFISARAVIQDKEKAIMKRLHCQLGEKNELFLQHDKKKANSREIKSQLQFQLHFGPKYKIESSPSAIILTEWNNEAGYEKIRSWLMSYGQHFASFINKNLNRSQVQVLYPLIINSLVPLMNVSHSTVEVVSPTGLLSNEERDLLAHDIIAAISDEEVSGIPRSVDISNSAEVHKLLLLVENIISLSPNYTDIQRHVEVLMIRDGQNANKRIVLEIKPYLFNDDDEGFFQCAANMVINGIPYGVCTSHQHWKFLKMEPLPSPSSSEPQYIIRLTDIYNLMKGSYKEMDEDSVVVYAHLLEMFGVPITTDLMASSRDATAATVKLGEALTGRLAK